MEKHAAKHKGFNIMNSKNSLLILLLAVFLPLFLVVLVHQQTITQYAAASHQVTIQNFTMNPSSLTITVGDTVTWTNQDVVSHDAHSIQDVFASPLLKKGESYSFTFTQPGRYEYYCTPHKDSMKGFTIVVLPAAQNLSPTPQVTSLPVPNSPTPTVQPTAAAPQPTKASPVVGSSNLTVILKLHGMGQAGDSANPSNSTMSNKSPKQPERLISLILVDGRGQTVAAAAGSVVYASDTGDFRGTIDLGSKFTPGFYTVKVKMQKYLVKTIVSNFNILANAINTLPATELVAGDIDGNNLLDVNDYNALLACLDKNGVESSCQGKRRLEVDLNDDGKIGIQDTNLLLREFLVKNGD